jgi:hypothetical protein
VLESVAHLKPLGVGINLQPNAVRELYELGIGPESLATIGVQTKEWALVGLNGNDVYSEPQVTSGRSTPFTAAACRCSCTRRRLNVSVSTPSARAWRSPAIAAMRTGAALPR